MSDDSIEDMDIIPESGWQSLMSQDIMIKILQEGIGELAEVGSVIKCSYDCYILDAISKERKCLVEHADDQCYKVGEGDCVPGLELALRHAVDGRHMLVRCSSKFAYGFTGRPAINDLIVEIPPDHDLEYHIMNMQHVDNTSLSPLQQADAEVKLRKDCGNRWFAGKDYQRAGRAYSKGIQVAEGVFGNMSDDIMASSEVKDLQASYIFCLNNLAATYICTSDYVKAKDICIRVLEIQPMNVKAMLRAAKASLGLDEYDECEACLNRVLEIEPGNADAMKERTKLKQAQKRYKESSKKMAAKMSKRLFDDDHNTSLSSLSSPSSSSSSSSTDHIAAIDTQQHLDGPISSLSSSDTMQSHDDDDEEDDDGNLSSYDNTPSSTSPPIATPIHDDKINTINKKLSAASAASRKNTVMFLITSLVVVLVSVMVFYIITQQQPTETS